MTALWWMVAIIVLLVLANALFVAAEFAILAAPKTTIQAEAAKGDATARGLQAVLSRPSLLDRYFATAQVGITFASLGLGMYGEHALAERLAPHLQGLGAMRWVGAHILASIVAVAILTYLHIVVGEMLPKAVALQHAHRTSRMVLRPMQGVRILFWPLVVGLNAAANGVLRLMGVRRDRPEDRYHSPGELRLVVEESRGSGALREEEGRLLQESLDFSDLTAAQIMVPRVLVAGVPMDADLTKVDALVRSAPHTRYPVYRGHLDHVVGVIHVKDLRQATIDGRLEEAADLRTLPFVPESAPLDRVLAILRGKRAHMAVVMDEHGGTAGILTIEDLMEEIVGEIDEEAPGRDVVRRPEGVVDVQGSLRLDELEEALGHPVEHPEVDTVSGLVLDLLGRPPQVGDTAVYAGLRFEVQAVSGRGVRICRVSPVRPTPPERPPERSDR